MPSEQRERRQELRKMKGVGKKCVSNLPGDIDEPEGDGAPVTANGTMQLQQNTSKGEGSDGMSSGKDEKSDEINLVDTVREAAIEEALKDYALVEKQKKL